MRFIKAPVLFLSGGQDELVPAQMMEKLHEVRVNLAAIVSSTFVAGV